MSNKEAAPDLRAIDRNIASAWSAVEEALDRAREIRKGVKTVEDVVPLERWPRPKRGQKPHHYALIIEGIVDDDVIPALEKIDRAMQALDNAFAYGSRQIKKEGLAPPPRRRRAAYRRAIRAALAQKHAAGPDWLEAVADTLRKRTGDEFDTYHDPREAWGLLENTGRGPDWRVFPTERQAEKYAVQALAEMVEENPAKFSWFLEFDIPHSYTDHVAQDAAHARIDSLSDRELQRGHNISLDDAREELWDQVYEDTRDEFEADPLSWWEKQGINLERGNLPLVVDIDHEATARNMIEQKGLAAFLHHGKGKPLSLRHGLAFIFDGGAVRRGRKI